MRPVLCRAAAVVVGMALAVPARAADPAPGEPLPPPRPAAPGRMMPPPDVGPVFQFPRDSRNAVGQD